MGAWNGWYHVSSSTYGVWLPGDPRGFRTRHHREHVDGDYRNPPPKGRYDALHERSRRLMKYAPVHLTRPQRRLAVEAIVEKVQELELEVLVASVDAVHYHLLGRFADGEVRTPVGRAKKHTWHLLVERGFTGKSWARGCHVRRIADRSHQLNAYQYICEHVEKGAYVWTFKDGVIEPDA